MRVGGPEIQRRKSVIHMGSPRDYKGPACALYVGNEYDLDKEPSIFPETVLEHPWLWESLPSLGCLLDGC